MIIRLTSIFLLALALPACQLLQGEEERGEKVARVFDRVLYEEDLREVMPSGLSSEDSALWVRKYINNWGKEQLIISKAEFNLADREKDFDELVEQYRNDLLKFTYQQRYVDEHLDTAISREQIEAYYEEHQKEFELKENILKLNYIVLNTDVPELAKARSLFKEESEESLTELKEFAFKYARASSFGDTSWVRFNDVAKFIPVQTYNQQEFLSRNHFVEISDSTGTYLVDIIDYKIAEDVSPLPYVVETIRNIILNKRKQELIATMEERIVNDAYEKSDFEIY